jgi:hypothetical protein
MMMMHDRKIKAEEKSRKQDHGQQQDEGSESKNKRIESPFIRFSNDYSTKTKILQTPRETTLLMGDSD